MYVSYQHYFQYTINFNGKWVFSNTKVYKKWKLQEVWDELEMKMCSSRKSGSTYWR